MEYKKLVDVVGPLWAELLKDFMVENEEGKCDYQAIAAELRKQKNDGVVFFPESRDVFRCFKETPAETLRVVLLGMDPYPKAGYADGLAFSTQHKDMPQSLSKIHDGIEDDIHNGLDLAKYGRNHNLESWAHQGVLLLNSALTVVENDPGSHSALWKPFTEYLVKTLNERKVNTVWVAFGNVAKKFVDEVNPFRSFVFTAEHPATAAKAKPQRAWAHNHVFSKINSVIKLNNLGEPIKW